MGESVEVTAHRLGKRELGRHAYETRMPQRLWRAISDERDDNKLYGAIPALRNQLLQDAKVKTAFLCREQAVQIFRLPIERQDFCGYRNIQMSMGLNATIPQLQDDIEAAWERGFNSHGRIETGGLCSTRKHIGTSEAQALMLSKDIEVKQAVFSGTDAWRQLLDHSEAYFQAGEVMNEGIHITTRQPLFLQRPRHSLSVVGVAISVSGTRSLLVFDPGYRPTANMKAIIRNNGRSRSSATFLRFYRRKERHLKRYQKFELLWRTDEPGAPGPAASS